MECNESIFSNTEEVFYENREGFLISQNYRQCTNCRTVFKKTSKTVTLCNKCNTDRVKSQSAEYKMLQRAKMRAKENNLNFNISISDIFIPKKCPILNIQLVSHSGKSGAFRDSPSLDRINPSLGYVKGNIWVISNRANAMKSDSSISDMINFAKWVLDNYTDKN